MRGCARRTTLPDIVLFSSLSALDTLQAGQSGPGLGLRSGPGASPHGAPASAPPRHATPMVGPRGAGVAHASDAGARATPASSSRRVSFLLTPEQERRVSTGGSLCDSGNDTVPSSPRVVVTRRAGQPAGASKAADAYVGLGHFRCGRVHSVDLSATTCWCGVESPASCILCGFFERCISSLLPGSFATSSGEGLGLRAAWRIFWSRSDAGSLLLVLVVHSTH